MPTIIPSSDAREAYGKIQSLLGPQAVERRTLRENPQAGMAFHETVVCAADEDGRITMTAMCSPYSIFIPRGLTEEDETMLQEYVGIPAEVGLMLSEVLPAAFNGTPRYEVMPWFNLAPRPLLKDCRDSSRDNSVTIEGVFRGQRRNRKKEPAWIIQTSNGEITVTSYLPLVYTDGLLENMKDERVIVGETIRVHAYKMGSQYSILIDSEWVYSVTPTLERQREFDHHRRFASAAIGRMHRYALEGNYKYARLYFGNLRKFIALTQSEQRQVESIMKTLPPQEQAMYLQGLHYEDNGIEQAFGVNIETLNSAQFLTFAHEVLSGSRQTANEDEKALWSITSYLAANASHFKKEELTSLLYISMHSLFERLEASQGDSTPTLLALCDVFLVASTIDDAKLVSAVEALIDHCIELCTHDPIIVHILPLRDALEALDRWKQNKAASMRISRKKIETWRQQLEKIGETSFRDVIEKLKR